MYMCNVRVCVCVCVSVCAYMYIHMCICVHVCVCNVPLSLTAVRKTSCVTCWRSWTSFWAFVEARESGMFRVS